MEKMTYREVLNEAKSYFDTLQVGNMLGQGYFTIASEPALFEQYVDAMTRGIEDADTKAVVKNLMENNNREIMIESSMTGLAPIYAMSNPLIRMLYPRMHLKEAVKVIVADNPKLLITYMAPYILKKGADGRPEKFYIPYNIDAAYDKDNDGADITGHYIKKDVALASAVTVYDVWEQDGATRFADVTSQIKFQPLDDDFTFSYIKFAGATESDPETFIQVGLKPTAVNGTMAYDYNDGTHAGKVIITVEYEKAIVTIAYIATKGDAPKSVGIIAHYSTEFHEKVVSVGVESMRDEITIPTAEWVSAAMPQEFLADMQAQYKVSGTEELTKTMSNLVELQLDKRIAKFIADEFVSQPGRNKYYQHLGTNETKFAVFNVKPSVTFNGTTRAWRDEIRTLIDDLAARIEINTYLEDGVYNVVCNPKDAQLINNIDWKFSGGADKVDGVSVSYSVGTYTGTHLYRVISSPQMPQGYVYIMFIPSGRDQLTYVYCPYSFVMESNYRDPNRQNLPSLTVAKRDTQKSILPAMACIQVINNGSSLTGDNVYDTYRDFMPVQRVDEAATLDFTETGKVDSE